MYDIEFYYCWRGKYILVYDECFLFYGWIYSEFIFFNKVYNYFIYLQWDEFGLDMFYLKVIYVDYDEVFVIIEFIGEWNDVMYNDIMYFKWEVIDWMFDQGIYKYIMVCENVFNFYGLDDCYYEEWYEDVVEEGGWICFVNILLYVNEEMKDI